MAKLLRQTWAQTRKTLLITSVRHWFSTFIRAFALPVIFILFMAYARNLFIPRATFGVGEPAPVKTLANAMDPSLRLVLISNGLTGDVEDVIDAIAGPLRDIGRDVRVLEDNSTLSEICRQTLRGSSECYAVARFLSSPDNPDEDRPDGWNYEIMGDASLNREIEVDNHDGDTQTRLFPLQNAIDFAIGGLDSDSEFTQPEEYMFTDMTEEEREEEIRTGYQGAIIDVISVTFLIALIGSVYQLVGFMAMEREEGIAQLIEAMGGSKWSRLLSYHLAFDIIYFPSWIIIAIVLGSVFANTSKGLLIILHILAGLSFNSVSLFGAAFFRRAQLSGITVSIVILLLGIVGQFIHGNITSNGTIAILGLIFPPMTYLFAIISVASFEREEIPASLTAAAPGRGWTLPAIIFWVFFIVQILVFPFLAAMVEKWRYGVNGKGRVQGTQNSDNAVEIRGFVKRYVPGFFDKRGGIFMRKSKRKETVVAVNDLTLDVRKGSVVGLLGANGSGKTTTLESIVGLGKITDGSIALDETGSIGVCPQKNVLWDDLTVEEHVRIWNRIKSASDDRQTIVQLIRNCDLGQKIKAKSSTLSGGQKRKLQLAIMFTGGSNICAIDEVSSGLDPLSRRKIWDIILDARGRCTIIHTTHFLDEADLLSDHIAILSKGTLRAEGSPVVLKANYGGGYRVSSGRDAPDLEGIPTTRLYDQTVYNVPDSESASHLIRRLEDKGVDDYHVNGPTIEDVFLKVANDSLLEAYGPDGPPDARRDGVALKPGRRLGVFQQAWVMFRKRITVLRRNYLPIFAAVALPILAAALTMLLFEGYDKATCAPIQSESRRSRENRPYPILTIADPKFLLGPSDQFDVDRISRLARLFPTGDSSTEGGQFDLSSLENIFTFVETEEEFNNAIKEDIKAYHPGGIFLRDGDEGALFAWVGNDGGARKGMAMHNLVNNIVTNATINMSYGQLAIPWAPSQGKTLQFITYFGLAMSVFPAFFALYPNIERTRQVRALHYSNGVRPLPLWLAYLFFDFMFALLVAVVSVIIFAASLDVWYGIGYLFLVMALYGLASILLSYVISLITKTQLAAFAFAAGGQALIFQIYFVGYMAGYTFAPVTEVDQTILAVHWGIGAVAPIGNLVRALFIALNSFQITCDEDNTVADNLGKLTLYGGPILYLILHCVILFSLLLWYDSGKSILDLFKRRKNYDNEPTDPEVTQEKEVTDELTRIASSNDGLRVLHLTKQFGKNLAVDNVTFGVQRSEVLALLGPNGAGKSTTINMIRGDLKPDDGDIFVENISVISNRATARRHLGVCPQFDAIDSMTVKEHLEFYARARGVEDVDHNVAEVTHAVGLQPYGNRMAAALSGGNKRKLSLGIALMGNPTVLLLDEPSSGMDAASKRVMWKTLAAIVPGRSLILTTHSMEEADALANRAGILAKRMLAVGTGDSLRRRYGDKYHIHLVLKSAPNSTEEEMAHVKNWIIRSFAGADVEEKSFHGQIKFSVPAGPATPTTGSEADDYEIQGAPRKTSRGVSGTFALIEANKQQLGLEYYSVAQTGLEEIFLRIVGENNVVEEGYAREGEETTKKKKKFGVF